MNRLSNHAARIAVAVLLPAMAGGQMVSPTMSDATVVARGSVRFRGLIEWTRYDAVFGLKGKRTLPLGAVLTTDLDVPVLPLLEPARLAVQALTGTSSVQLNLGKLRTSADSRIASVPISLEYGLTDRITLGISVPIVQTRSVVTAQLNGRGDSTANVGVNPAGFLFVSSAFAANLQVTSGLTAARAQLVQRKQACAVSPASSGCPAFNARLSEVDALITDAGVFAFAASDLYGISFAQPGAPFVPMAGSAIQLAIDTQLAGLRSGFTSFGISGGTGAFVAAKGFAANAQLREMVQDERFGIGLDSIGTTEQLALGDIELSVTSQLFNSFSDTLSGGTKWRGSFAGIVRLGTGHTARQGRPFDIGTGDGQTDLEVRAAIDLLVRGRLLTTVAGTYTQQLGTVSYNRLPYSPELYFVLDAPIPGSIKRGNMAALRLNPRLLITRGLMVGGLFTGAHRGADQTTITGIGPSTGVFGNPNSVNTWAGGLTLSYSNLATRAGTGNSRFPAEIHFSHLETVGATAIGAEKTVRDVIELRFYFRARR